MDFLNLRLLRNAIKRRQTVEKIQDHDLMVTTSGHTLRARVTLSEVHQLTISHHIGAEADYVSKEGETELKLAWVKVYKRLGEKWLIQASGDTLPERFLVLDATASSFTKDYIKLVLELSERFRRALAELIAP